MNLHFRSQTSSTNAEGKTAWTTSTREVAWATAETAIVICDMWDKHWSRGATERVGLMAPRMNEVIKASRAKGVTIVHAPSETMDFYRGSPARQRVLEAPPVPWPAPADHINPPLPIDDSDGGSDTGEKPWYMAWHRQHAAIEIDQERDAISDNGAELWRFYQQRKIKNVIIMGVHTNMCVLNRSFAIRNMVRRGMNVVLVRDLTDAMYNPAMPPHVSHAEGTRLVIDYIEKYWCPTMDSGELCPVDPADAAQATVDKK
jgi:nicotinamidase-related amidase